MVQSFVELAKFDHLIYKMEVYRLAAWRNAHRPKDCLGPEGEVIPERILTKAPSAENLALLRGRVTEELSESYPAFADLLRGERKEAA